MIGTIARGTIGVWGTLLFLSSLVSKNGLTCVIVLQTWLAERIFWGHSLAIHGIFYSNALLFGPIPHPLGPLEPTELGSLIFNFNFQIILTGFSLLFPWSSCWFRLLNVCVCDCCNWAGSVARSTPTTLWLPRFGQSSSPSFVWEQDSFNCINIRVVYSQTHKQHWWLGSANMALVLARPGPVRVKAWNYVGLRHTRTGTGTSN